MDPFSPLGFFKGRSVLSKASFGVDFSGLAAYNKA